MLFKETLTTPQSARSGKSVSQRNGTNSFKRKNKHHKRNIQNNDNNNKNTNNGNDTDIDKDHKTNDNIDNQITSRNRSRSAPESEILASNPIANKFNVCFRLIFY